LNTKEKVAAAKRVQIEFVEHVISLTSNSVIYGPKIGSLGINVGWFRPGEVVGVGEKGAGNRI
jgi:hypothetical protein